MTLWSTSIHEPGCLLQLKVGKLEILMSLSDIKLCNICICEYYLIQGVKVVVNNAWMKSREIKMGGQGTQGH